MIGEEKLFKRLARILAASPADEAEVVYWGTQSGVTRYANSTIHQNVYEDNCKVYFRTAFGKQIGVASTNSLVLDDLEQALNNSCAIAKMQPLAPDFLGLPKLSRYRSVDAFERATARFTPGARAAAVRKVIGVAERSGFQVAGAFSTTTMEFAVVSSRGVRAYQPVTVASISIIVSSETSSGYAAGFSSGVAALDLRKLAKIAADKCDSGRNPIELEPGDYEVILEPSAVAELLAWLGFIGFGSKPFEEKTSFLSGGIGRKITSEMVTITDDVYHPLMIGIPFDMEGVPKRKVTLIDKGVARGVVLDRPAARRFHKQPTGHAITPDYAFIGGRPWNIRMSPGRSNRSEMVSAVKRGILVTRFHYVRGGPDPRNAALTGMTRDGTFLIENGRIKSGIKNLRFTDSITRAFKSTIAVSKEVEAVEPVFGGFCIVAPTVHLGSFKFTGVTGT